MNTNADFLLDADDESVLRARDGQLLPFSRAIPKPKPPTDAALQDALRAYRASENDLMEATLAYPNPQRDEIFRHRAVVRLARMCCRKDSDLQGREDELIAATLQQLGKRQDGHKEDLFAAAQVVTKAIADDMKDEEKSPGTCGWTKELVKEAMRAFANPSGDAVLRQQVVWNQVLEFYSEATDELKGREDEMVVRALQQLGERHYGVYDDIYAGALVAVKDMTKRLKCPRPNQLNGGVRHAPEACHLGDLSFFEIQAQTSRDALEVLLHTAVSYHAERFAKKLGHLALDEGDMFTRGMRRLENKELECGQLLADFDETKGGYVLTYLKIGIESIARNMETEAYVREGGLHGKDIIQSVKAATGQSLRSGTLVEAPLTSGNSDDTDATPERVPDGQWVSETLSKNSHIRVRTLRDKLGEMCTHESMVGKKKAFLDDQMTVIDITENHRRLWFDYLGLSDPRYLDLSEQELADVLTGKTKIGASFVSRFLSLFKPTGKNGGSSKPSLTRASTIGFAYLLAHPNLRQILVLMEPSSALKNSSHTLDPKAKLIALETLLKEEDKKAKDKKAKDKKDKAYFHFQEILRDKPGQEVELSALEAQLRNGGKDYFRRILRAWIKKHA